MPQSVIIIPCYNEAARLPTDGFASFKAEGVRLLFVDDGSTDQTFDMLQEIARTLPSASVLRLQQNAGKAEAVRQGILNALEGQPDYVGYFDADLATPLYVVSLLVDCLEHDPQIELMLGSRVLLLGRCIERNPARHYLSRVFATLASLMLDLPVYDTQCGAKVLRVTQRTRGVFEQPFQCNWSFDVEMLGRYLSVYRNAPDLDEYSGFCEYPLPEWRDIPGSKVGIKDGFSVLLELAALYRGALYRLPRRPAR